MDDRARLTYLPLHYYDLQALRFAPLWIALLASLVYTARPGHWVPQGSAGRVLPSLGLLAVEALWYWVTMQYCRWRFGHLEVKQNILTVGFSWWWIFLALDQCAQAPWGATPWAWRHSPWYPGPVIAIFLILPVFDSHNPLMRRIRYAAGATVVTATTTLSSLHGWDARPFIATTCITVLALGIGDHLLLMSLRNPVRENADV